MKLKEAVKVAQRRNRFRKTESMSPIAYIATDADGAIWGYTCEPYINDYEGGWVSPVIPINFLSVVYTGSKHWSNTCRKV